jgi:hypothetical protein
MTEVDMRATRLQTLWSRLKGYSTAGGSGDTGRDDSNAKRGRFITWIQDSFGMSRDAADRLLRFWESKQRDKD